VLEPDGRLRVQRFPARLYGIRLNPNEMRSVTLEVRAPVNSRFTVGLAQYVRGTLVGGNSYQRVLPPCPISLPIVQVSNNGCQPGRTYTVDADFDEGLLINVNHNAPNNHQLQLNDAVTPLPYIWIALSGRGTIAKVNTQTGVVLGEYLSAPNGRSRNPSRTTVDLNGNVWVGNRDEASGGKGSVVQIGLRENFQCVDRNGNGVIDTSTGLGDVKPWPNPGGVDNNGGVSSAQDECIINYVRTNGANVRTVAVDAQNDVWVGGFTNHKHDLIDGDTGAVLRSITPACGGYGGLIDSSGVLWSVQHPTSLLRYDPATNTSQCIAMTNSYGLGLDSSGVIWNSRFSNRTITRLSPAGVILSTVSTGGNDSRGVAVTSNDHIWIANSGSNTVTRLRNNGTLLATIPVGTTPTGVSVDAAGKVWVTNYGSNNAMRINPATNAVDLTVPLGAGAQPYNYSDMTGSVVLGSPPQGKWVVVYDSGAAGTPWGKISWNSHVPAGTSLSVRVRSAQTSSGLGSQPWVTVGNGVPFTTVPAGRFLQIEVQFTGTDAGASPILYDLTVSPSCAIASGAQETTP
jgi:streptogramin lyase